MLFRLRRILLSFSFSIKTNFFLHLFSLPSRGSKKSKQIILDFISPFHLSNFSNTSAPLDLNYSSNEQSSPTSVCSPIRIIRETLAGGAQDLNFPERKARTS